VSGEQNEVTDDHDADPRRTGGTCFILG
jgi:hypothetical protein